MLLLIKTAADRTDAAISAIRESHPYQVPEVLAVTTALGAYAAWVHVETRSGGAPQA